MKNIINFIKELFGFENPDDSIIGLSSFKTQENDFEFSRPKTVKKDTEQTLSTLLTRKQFQ